MMMLSRSFALGLIGLTTAISSGCSTPPVDEETSDTSEPLELQMVCQNDGDNYFWEEGEIPGSLVPNRASIGVCVEFDPEDPDWGQTVKEACSDTCEELSDLASTTATPVCLDENWDEIWWKGVCVDRMADLDLDPVEDQLGSSVALAVSSLPCELRDTCAQLLEPAAALALVASTSDPRATADELKETDYGYVSLAGSGAAMTGTAAYTKATCSAAACPFYLAQLDVAASSTVTVVVTVGGSTLVKTIADLSVALERPTLGIWIPGTGDVIFPPNSLKVRVSTTVGGASNTFGENGLHDELYSFPHYVFGSLAGTALSLGVAETDALGAWSLDLRFVPE